ncbi:lipase family protein [Rhodococcus sp. NPDC003318]|uniref:lipase family protein n=1 Tax=Rhodococcus sp. NPDC003318 TaxID=3364503 RepID=UPI0036A9BB03
MPTVRLPRRVVTRVRRCVALAAALAAAASAAAPAVAEPTPDLGVPALGSVFTEYTLGTFRDGRIGSPQEIRDGLLATDQFFDEPPLRGDEKPGTLLRAAPFDVLFAGVEPGNLTAWKIMYVTENVNGSRDVSTGVVMIPEDGRDNATRPVVAYQQANDSVGPNCHPSSHWSGAAQTDASAWSALGPLAQMWSAGLATVISDLGNDADPAPHGVFAGRFAGMALINGIRAAYQVEGLGLSPQSPVGIFGVAGGGVGGGFAAEYQPDYAPEINLRATVLEAMAVNQRDFVEFASGGLGSGFAFATLLGLEAQYPQMRIDEKLTPAGRALADVFRDSCQIAYFGTPFLPLNALFRSGENPADIADFQPVFAQNDLGVGTAPTSKVLITNCGSDNSFMAITPASEARDLADRYRAGGTDVTYQPLDCGADVLLTDPYRWGTELLGMHTVDWLTDRLD